MEQKTVNLVIVIAAVVIAAGAWSAPLLTAQTTHTLIQGDLADAITTINQNTDSETGAIGAGFFGAGTDLDASFGDCTLMDLMISIALDENINQLCSPDEIQSFIESDIHFAEFNDQFEFEEQFIEILPMELLPNRDCAGNDLTDAEIFAYQNTGAAGSRTFQTDNAVGGGGAADGTVTILAVLPQFGGGGFEGATIGVFVENSVTGQAIPNIQLEISGVNFSEAAINFDGVENFQTTDAFGEVFFEGLDNNLDGLPGGDYTITFDGDAGLQSATTMVFVPPGFGGFIDVFLQISPT